MLFILVVCLKELMIVLCIVCFLLSYGVWVDIKDFFGWMVLFYVCENGYCKLVKLFLDDDDDFDVNMVDIEGNIFFMYVVMYGNV